MEELLSVIIPTHNRASLIERAIKSLIKQTYKNIEIIVVSDGSTDNTADIVNKLAETDDRIRFFEHHPAKGANFARNFGADIATGKFLGFLDDDDEWSVDKASKQMEFLKENPDIGLCVCGMDIKYVLGNTSAIYIPNPPKDASKEILIDNCIGGTPTAIIKRDIFNKIGGFDEKIFARQDYDLWIRAAQETMVGTVKEPLLMVYDYEDPEKVSKNTWKHIETCKLMEEKYKDLYAGLTKKENSIRKYNFAVSISKKALRNNERKLAREYARKALKYRLSIVPFALLIMSLFGYGFVLRIKNKLVK